MIRVVGIDLVDRLYDFTGKPGRQHQRKNEGEQDQKADRLRKTEKTTTDSTISVGDLSLDVMSQSVSVYGTAVKLTRTEFAILKLLMNNPGQVISKAALLDRISLDTPDCTERSLKQHISNLRKKLQDVSGADYIETVWGIGFKLAEQKS